MSRFTSSRWLAVGGAAVSVGATLGAAFWIYVLTASHRTFWRAPGFISLGLIVLGSVLLVIGFVWPSDAARGRQEQNAGSGSTNLQAGGDISINDRSGGSQ